MTIRGVCGIIISQQQTKQMTNINAINNWFEKYSECDIWYSCKNPVNVKFMSVNGGDVYIFYGEQVLHVSEDDIRAVEVVNFGRAIVIFTNLAPTEEMLPNTFVFSVDKHFSFFDWKKAELAKKKKQSIKEDDDEINEEAAKEYIVEEILEIAEDYMDIYEVDEIRIIRCSDCGGLNFFTYRND